jgi:hypothetical protein
MLSVELDLFLSLGIPFEPVPEHHAGVNGSPIDQSSSGDVVMISSLYL